MSAVKWVVKNILEFEQNLEAKNKARVKAARRATRRQGFLLMQALKEEIRAGAPGSVQFSPLTEIAKRTGRRPGRKPLSRLAVAVRYAGQAVGTRYEVSVGFMDSPGWERLAKGLQEGEQNTPNYIARRAILLLAIARKKEKAAGWRLLFLRKETKVLHTPPRRIIDPFWAAHQSEALRNIRINFERKMRGEWI